MSRPLQFFMVFLLQLEVVISGKSITLYHRVGDDVTLSSNVDSSYHPCSDFHWFYHKDVNAMSQDEFNNGKVEKTSSRAGRLSLCRNCSLVIKNITAEDAGQYTCRIKGDPFPDTSVYLNILSISPSPPEADASRDESVTLQCSLLRYSHSDPCEQNSLRWMDEAGTELLGEGDWYEFRGQTNCVSVLTVKHHRNRRFTCQFALKGSNKTFAEYKLDFTDVIDFPLTNTNVIIGVAVGTVTAILAAITFLSVHRMKTKPDQKKNTNFQKLMHQNDDPENNMTYASVDEFNPKTSSKDESEDIVTYAAVDHSNLKTSFKIKVKEEEDMVTYSAVRTKMKAEVDSNLSGLSSSFRKNT